MNKLKYIILSLLVFLVFNCKSSRTISGGEANFKLSTKQLLKENSKQTPVFKTLQSKLKITYNQDGNEQSYTVNFRAKKDEMLWISATFSVVKALITPEKVSFYNKLDNTYFEGDYKYLSDLLGTELDFQKVQNLLLGEAIFSLNANTYDVSITEEAYILQPKNQRELFEIFFLLDPVRFKVKSQQISQPKEFRHLQIDYLTYQEVDKQTLPENIKIIAVEANKETNIELEFKSVTLNENLSFPYKIPSGFKEIKL
jgi:outer membrane biogenesis lipoprotein LolB